jgi:dienelactone hydrolase
MVDGIHAYLDGRIEESVRERARYWKPDFSSREAYERSVQPNRARLGKILGVVDVRVPFDSPALVATVDQPARIAGAPAYEVFAVSWPALEGVTGEGLLLQPKGRPVARVVALPDADLSPEMLAGLAKGVDPAAQFARRLAESGCQVIVPVLIDRNHTWAGHPDVRLSNQSHREFVSRIAFEVGRHIIGYEVQKVLALVDWFDRENRRQSIPIAVAGYGEGGLLALASAALDTRIAATLVSGHFQPREGVWKEPIYRNVWSLLKEFGDAGMAALIAPRALVVEAARGPEVAAPGPDTKERRGAAPHGVLTTPPLAAVRAEVERARPFYGGLQSEARLQLIESGQGRGLPGSDPALATLLKSAGASAGLKAAGTPPADARGAYDPNPRLRAQYEQMLRYNQLLVDRSPKRREEFWSKADSSSPERWAESKKFYRDYFWDEVIGRLPPPGLPPKARTRLVYDEPKFRGYEVVLDVWPQVIAYGILLAPKDLKPGERRPVVVCQHGLEGRPSDVADPRKDDYHHHFGAKLADQGFIVYAPQNPYIGRDRFRTIQRKAHPLKVSLFSFIVGQNQQLLAWLGSLPFVDASRIGFYGISYGGKTAMRIPSLLDGYAVSICSADFNEWVWKTTRYDTRWAYPGGGEYDMYEFDFANVVNYAELATLIAPRPFMVERGHGDGVAPDEWVAYEYAKVQRFYATRLKMPEKTEIEYFVGPHEIRGEGTFRFLRKHLRWPD